jgi:hypothetical protein
MEMGYTRLSPKEESYPVIGRMNIFESEAKITNRTRQQTNRDATGPSWLSIQVPLRDMTFP